MQNNPPVTPVEFYALGQRMTNQSLLRNESGKRRFLSHFGISPEVVAILWTSIHHMLPPSSLSIHLLWCLLFMKVYASESVLCGIVGTNEKSFRQHVWIVITAISSQRNQFVSVQYNLFIMSSTLQLLTIAIFFCQISLTTRFNHQNGSCCLLSVDGTDFLINEPIPFSKDWFSHKFKGAGLRYEVAIAIQSGDLAWINGPFPCGLNSDLTIFRLGLKQQLLPGERVEADDGYRGDERCDGPFDYCYSEEQYRSKFTVRARHETINRRFKQFGILSTRFRHPRGKHGDIFMAIAVITQISIRNGNPLFPLNYRTYNGN